mgnify:CR=1 FL=1
MALTEKEKGYTAQDWAELGKMGRAKQATERAGDTWSTELHKTLAADAAKTERGQDTQKYKDWVVGPSGYTDIYRSGASTIKGPEYGIPDVDIHGYPTGWKQEAGTKDGDEGQWITTDKGQKYFKPSDAGDSGGGGGGGDGGGNNIVVQDANRETPNLAELTDQMMLSNRVSELINRDSPLYRAAMTKAMQRGQKRGILDSSINRGEVEKAIMAVALPIAQQEVQALQQNLYYNTDWTNKDKFMANEAAYNRMLTQLQGSINMTLQKFISGQAYGLQELRGTQATALQELVGGQEMTIAQDKLNAEIWGKYGDWITEMATAEGADQDAWKRMMDMLKGSGGWPKI